MGGPGKPTARVRVRPVIYLTVAQRSSFRPAWWLPGPHLPTIYGRLARRLPAAPTRAERWPTPDGDAVTVHRLSGQPGHPRVLLLHGLESGIHAPYVQGLLHQARLRGWWADLLVWRTCDPAHVVNAVPRAYHSGETTDLAMVVRRLVAESPGTPVGIVGVSLGGNVLLKWLGNEAATVPPEVTASVAVSVPFDLGRASRHLERGINTIYTRYFLRSLVAKTERKLTRFPDLVDATALRRLRTLWEFDDVVTGPIHGFAGAADYYARCSSLPTLGGVDRPTLLLNAADDPFLPRQVLDDVRVAARGTSALTIEFPERGGHVGFVAGAIPGGARYWMEGRVFDWLSGHLASRAAPIAREPAGTAA